MTNTITNQSGLRDEIRRAIPPAGTKELARRMFHDLYLAEKEKEAILSSLLGGHHLLLVGPPGCGKTTVAQRITTILPDTEVVAGCPVHCSPQNPSCPWCSEIKARGGELKGRILPGNLRVERIQGSGGLSSSDLIGDLDPELAFTHGIRSLQAFVPGKLLRANRGILLIDFLDCIPERTLNTILYTLQGEPVSIGASEETIPLDVLIVATAREEALQSLPTDILDNFDVIPLGYLENANDDKQVLRNHLGPDQGLGEDSIDKIVDVVRRTRTHIEVERGVSTRGMLRCAEFFSSFRRFKDGGDQKAFQVSASVSLPHRLRLPPETDSTSRREHIVAEVVQEVLGEKPKEEGPSFSKEDMLDLVEEIARETRFSKPLRYGALDLLLKRIHRFPESKLARMHRQAMEHLEELYPERYKGDNITEEMLKDIEEARKEREELKKRKELLAAKALAQTINLLERHNVLQRDSAGWTLGQRGINLLLDRLAPRLWAGAEVYGYGKHSTGRKIASGEGRIIDIRQFRLGDRYRDISLRETIRETIRHRREAITREDIMVTTKDIRAKLDIVLVIDLSGTMHQLEKLWYAKQSAITLSLAAAQHGDRVGVITFSDLAQVVVDLTSNPHKVTKHVLDLELHENAFTNIGAGILKAHELFNHYHRGHAFRHIILISDGDATVPHPSPQKYALKQAARAARKGITISCVCINGESSDPELMKKISRIGKGNIYLIGFEELGAILPRAALLAAS